MTDYENNIGKLQKTIEKLYKKIAKFRHSSRSLMSSTIFMHKAKRSSSKRITLKIFQRETKNEKDYNEDDFGTNTNQIINSNENEGE